MPNGQKKTAHAGRENIRYGVAFLILLILLVIFLAMNVCIGTVNVPVAEIPKILSGHGADETFSDIVMGIRFPRALAAAILGGALALSGYLLQTFFHNPIASPFTLGISSGAKLVVALIMVASLGYTWSVSSWVMILAAFVGAMICMGFVILMSRVMDNMSMLIVSGVMIGYICSAITDFVVTFADDANIVNLHNWSKGSFSGITWENVVLMTIVTGITADVPCSSCYAFQCAVRMCYRVCRTGFLRGNCSAASGEEPVPDSKADPDDSSLFSGRSILLSVL